MGASSRRAHLIKRPSSSLLIITGRSLLLRPWAGKVQPPERKVATLPNAATTFKLK
jgi:hypothetical protein